MLNALHYLRITVTIVILSALGGCSTLQVSHDFDPTINFSEKSSYSWQIENTVEEGDEPPLSNPLLHQRIRTAIDRNMGAKGYNRVDSDLAHMQLGYQARFISREAEPRVRIGFGFGSRSMRTFSSVGISTTTGARSADTIELAINIYDAVSGEPIWVGVGEDRITANETPEESQRRIDLLVKAILAQFPPN